MAKGKTKQKPAVKGRRPPGKGGKKSARRPATTANPDKLAGIGRFTTQPDLLTLTRQLRSKQSEMDETRGSMGNAVLMAVKQKGVHKQALADYRKYDKLSDPELARRLKHFLHYCEIGGLNARADQQIEAFSIAEMAGAKEPTPIERAIKKAKPPKVEKPEAVEPMPPPPLAEAERPPISFN
jgi:hypothetical protein